MRFIMNLNKYILLRGKMNQENKNLPEFFGCLYFIWGLFILFQQTVNYKFVGENTIIEIINIISMIALIIYELLILEKANFKVNIISLCYIVLFLAMGALASYHQYGLTFFVAFLFIIVSGNVELNEILKSFLCFSGCILIMTVVLNKFNVIPNFYMFGDSRIRSSLGFGYYTFAAQIAFYFTNVYLVYRDKDITYSEIFLLIILNTYIFYCTNTRSPYLLVSIFLIYCLLKKIFHFSGLVFTVIGKYIISFIFPLSFFLIYWMTFRTPATIFTKLDKALSGRLNLNVAAFQNWGIHFLGQKVKFTTVSAFGNRVVNYNYIDSSYFQNLIVNGWAFTAIIIIGFMFLCIRTVKEKKDILAVALMIVAIHAMFDPQLIWPWFSPFSLFIGKLFPLKKLD